MHYDDTPKVICICGEVVPPPRVAIGYRSCLSCGEQAARKVRHTVGFIPKSNYVYVSPASLHLLRDTNPKRQQE